MFFKPQILIAVFLSWTLAAQANTASTDPSEKYAWGENIGWICFPTNGHGGVSVNPANGELGEG